MSQGIEKGNQLNIRIIVSPPWNSTEGLATHVQQKIQRNIQKHCLNKAKPKVETPRIGWADWRPRLQSCDEYSSSARSSLLPR